MLSNKYISRNSKTHRMGLAYMKIVKWSMALNKLGEEIDISDTQRGKTYYCLACGTEMIPRKGHKNAHHFAHKNIPENYSYESELHLCSKKVLSSYLEKNRIQNKPVLLPWACKECGEIFEVNLVENIEEVAIEKPFAFDGIIIRPDISLSDRSSARCIVEVIVQHKPEHNVVASCLKHDILLVEIDVNNAVITPDGLLSKAVLSTTICNSCYNDRLEKTRLIAVNEANRAKASEKLLQLKSRGHSVLPGDLWKLFETVRWNLKRGNEYYLLLNPKEQDGVSFIEYGNKRFYIDQDQVPVNNEDEIFYRCGDNATLSQLYRTYHDRRGYKIPYCVVFFWDDSLRLTKIGVKSFASQLQSMYYDGRDPDDYCPNQSGLKKCSAEECLRSMLSQLSCPR
jgi:hypothetical protein